MRGLPWTSRASELYCPTSPAASTVSCTNGVAARAGVVTSKAPATVTPAIKPGKNEARFMTSLQLRDLPSCASWQHHQSDVVHLSAIGRAQEVHARGHRLSTVIGPIPAH